MIYTKNSKVDNNKITLKYSQNFLKDSQLVDKIINKSSIKKGDLVYEIGPGKGILTKNLAKLGAYVVAIEKDKKLYDKLKEKFSGFSNIKIKLGDFLKVELPDNKDYKIFSNIPFSITAQVINKLTSANNPPQNTYLILQKKAAKKFAGQPYGKSRQKSLLLKPWFKFEIIHHFKKGDFKPKPDVDIVLLKMKTRENSLVQEKNTNLYKDFIVYGFNQSKPTLKKALKKIFTYKQFYRLANDLKFNKKATPTDLNFKQWLGLFKYFLKGVAEFKKKRVYGSKKKLDKEKTKIDKIHRTDS